MLTDRLKMMVAEMKLEYELVVSYTRQSAYAGGMSAWAKSTGDSKDYFRYSIQQKEAEARIAKAMVRIGELEQKIEWEYQHLNQNTVVRSTRKG